MAQTLAGSQGVGAGARGRGRALNAGLWVLQLLAAFAFFGAGYAKLSGAPEMVATFEQIGFGQWFRLLTGGLEVLGALLLLVPRLAGLGGLLLAGVMVGAVLTHLLLVGGSAVPALVLLAITATIAWGRRDAVLRLLGR